VGSHLADQTLLPISLVGGGEFATMPVTKHFGSHAGIIDEFLARRVMAESKDGLVEVRVR
jgi:RNA 3'-terminal phosphate cyclase